MVSKAKPGIRVEKKGNDASFDGYKVPNYQCQKCGLRMYDDIKECTNCNSKSIEMRTEDLMYRYCHLKLIFLFFNIVLLIYILYEVLS